MPARTVVTARQERLGAELRKLREQAGLTVRETARALGIDQTKISHMEAGRVGVSGERVRLLAAHYMCSDPQLVDALAQMATERYRGWWEDYRGILPAGFLDLAELEHHAVALQVISISHIPGLLQTPDYAHAVFAFTAPEAPHSAIEARVEHRMRRKAVLEQENPPSVLTVIHESALKIMVGNRRMAQHQLATLAEAATTQEVDVRVIPFAAEGFAGAGYSMLYARGPVPKLDTFQLDHAGGSSYLHSEANLRRHRTTLLRITNMACDASKSRDIINRASKET